MKKTFEEFCKDAETQEYRNQIKALEGRKDIDAVLAMMACAMLIDRKYQREIEGKDI